jgi:hypothetical protein
VTTTCPNCRERADWSAYRDNWECPNCHTSLSDLYSSESGRLARADRIIKAINRTLARAGVNVDAPDPKVLDWNESSHRAILDDTFDAGDEAILPGFGTDGDAETARDDCGDPHPFICDCCGHSVEFGRTCGMSVCARCAQVWVRDAAIQKAAKVRRVRKTKHQATDDAEHQKLHHVVISPSLGWYADLARGGYSREDAQEKTREVVKTILDEFRAQGVVARHSYRGQREDGSIRSESDDRGAWKERLFSGRDWFDDVRDLLAWKPHYHAVVAADWVQGGELTQRIEDETGWVIHRINRDNGSSLANDGAMASALTYTLSHADIIVNDDANNQSAVWEVGSFEGDIIRSDSRFSPHPADIEWADTTVRRYAHRTLGIKSGTTDCGAQLPAVDDPDELARRIIEEIFPGDDGGRDVDPDAVLYHVSEGNIQVDVSTTSGGGGDITVRDAFGEPIGEGGWGGGALPDVPNRVDATTTADPIVTDADRDECDDGCGDDHDGVEDGGDQDEDDTCDGTLIPLGEARQRGLLEDDDWVRDAPHVDEAREADEEWPDDLDPWRTSSPGAAGSWID